MALSPNNYNTNQDDDATKDLLKAAAKLRKEAEELEQSMKSRKNVSSSGKPKQGKDVSVAAGDQQQDDVILLSSNKYTSLKDSTWMISYRFASDAVNREDRSGDNDSSSKPIFYSGKIKVTFQADGYTAMENLDQNMKMTAASNVLKFQKFWGWDEETSRDDGMQYVLFSADVLLPESDPNYTSREMTKRFYFQCRVDRDSKTDEISMSDGTVTIKKDIEPPGGFWGLFNAGGILAQFRYCGNFLMKPWSKAMDN
jgi:hypothetical protein